MKNITVKFMFIKSKTGRRDTLCLVLEEVVTKLAKDIVFLYGVQNEFGALEQVAAEFLGYGINGNL